MRTRKKLKFLAFVFLVCASTTLSAQEWIKGKNIPQDISITSLQEYEGNIIAFGQRQWREGTQFFSEPRSFISKDNGTTWEDYINLDNGNTTANTLFFSNGRILTSGRKGDPQLDWIGALCFSDDGGNSWNEAAGVPQDISISKIQKWEGKLIAFGLKQWREGFQFFSEPKSFVSEDNGITWKPFVTITSQISTANSLMISNNRIITSGREGETQLDWYGAIFYTDDNGDNWTKANGLPSDVAVSEIVPYDGSLIAAGQRQWREGMQFFSEAKLYRSDDNGANWVEFIPLTKEISTAVPLLIKDGRIITAGRLGQAQMDWAGALVYSDLKV